MKESISDLSLLERLVLPKLLEGVAPVKIGSMVRLSDQNVRVAMLRLKMRYQVETLPEILERARAEFESGLP